MLRINKLDRDFLPWKNLSHYFYPLRNHVTSLLSHHSSSTCKEWASWIRSIDHCRKYHNIPSCSLLVTPKFWISIVYSFSWSHFNSQEKLFFEKKKLDSPKGENNGLLTLDCEQSLVSLLGHSRSTTLKSEKMTAFKAVAPPFRVRLSLRLTTRSSPGLFQEINGKIKREETAEPRPRFSQITHSYFRVRFIYASSLISESLEQATAPPNEELVNPLPPRTVLGVRSQTLRYTSTTHSPQLKVWSAGGTLVRRYLWICIAGYMQIPNKNWREYGKVSRTFWSWL